jgi:hypothetical protein
VVSKKTPVVAVLVEYNASRDIADKEGKSVRDIVYEDNEETGGWKNYNQSMRALVRHSRGPFLVSLLKSRFLHVYPPSTLTDTHATTASKRSRTRISNSELTSYAFGTPT